MPYAWRYRSRHHGRSESGPTEDILKPLQECPVVIKNNSGSMLPGHKILIYTKKRCLWQWQAYYFYIMVHLNNPLINCLTSSIATLLSFSCLMDKMWIINLSNIVLKRIKCTYIRGVTHTFDPRSRKAEAGGSQNWRPAWSTSRVSGQSKATQKNPCLTKQNRPPFPKKG